MLPMAWDVHAAVGVLDTEYLKKGVVRITAKSPGENPKVGTGFIVQLEPDVVHIVTAAHVVSGDAHPKVQFFTEQDVQLPATVKHQESSEDASGLALLIVRGKDAIPSGLTVLNLANTSHLSSADPILVVGHPRSAGDWAILSGSVVARQGRYVTIDANIDEGISGAPILHSAEVVGLVGEVRRYGRGVTSGSIREYLEGHGILKKEALSSNPPAVEVPNRASSASRPPSAKSNRNVQLHPEVSGEWDIFEVEDEKRYKAILDKNGNGPYTQQDGRFVTTKIDNRLWQGTWHQPGNDSEGGFEVLLSEDGAQAKGIWWYTRVGTRKNIPPREYGGTYHWKKATAVPISTQ